MGSRFWLRGRLDAGASTIRRSTSSNSPRSTGSRGTMSRPTKLTPNTIKYGCRGGPSGPHESGCLPGHRDTRRVARYTVHRRGQKAQYLLVKFVTFRTKNTRAREGIEKTYENQISRQPPRATETLPSTNWITSRRSAKAIRLSSIATRSSVQPRREGEVRVNGRLTLGLDYEATAEYP